MSVRPGQNGDVAVETAELLLERQLRNERLGLGVVVGPVRHTRRGLGERIGSCRHAATLPHPTTTRNSERIGASGARCAQNLGFDGGVPNTFLHPFAKPTRREFVTIVRGEGALRVGRRRQRVRRRDGQPLVLQRRPRPAREIADAVAAQLRTLGRLLVLRPVHQRPGRRSSPSSSSTLTLRSPDARVFFCRLGLRGRRHGDEAGPPRPTCWPANPSGS